MTPTFDPGFTQQYVRGLLRTINKDGSFNVRRRGLHSIAGSVYMHLVNLSWPGFLSVVAGSYVGVNFLFALLYMLMGVDSLHASERNLGLTGFARAFFFSAQTLTTVGYGALYPFGLAANLAAAVEAAIGLMGFALATGLLYARFSRPTARLVFSERIVVAPYRDLSSIQFRIANQRHNVLTDVEANVILMTVEQGPNGQLKRNFTELPLERSHVFFLALTWTVVHPIDKASPLFGKTRQDLERLQAEVLILLKGYDDSFSQVVHSRYSYRWDEIEWSARFAPAFEIAPEGHVVLDIARISDTARV